MIEPREDQPTGREWRIAALVAVGMGLLQNLPYLMGYLLARPGTEYTGLLVSVEDASYIGMIRQGMEGSWLYHLPYTTEAHAPAFLEVFYLGLGHLAQWAGATAAATWHLARFGADVALFLVTFGFVSFFLRGRERWIAFAFALVGAGFDWFVFPFDPATILEALPTELRMPEIHLFFSALSFPHFAAGATLILVCFWLGYQILEEPSASKKWGMALSFGLANLALVLVYPFLALLTGSVLGVFILIRTLQKRRIEWGYLLPLGVGLAMPASLLVYYWFVLVSSPVFRLWNEQATTLSPNLVHYLLAYAPYLLFGLPLLVQSPNRPRPELRRIMFIWVWVGITALLLYAPVNPQRRFVEALQVPMAILAAAGVGSIVLPALGRTVFFERLAARPGYSVAGLERLAVFVMVGCASFTSLYLFASSLVQLAVIQPYPLFRPTPELRAMNWLGTYGPAGSVILSSYWTGSFIPARNGATVFVGNRYETLHFEEKRKASETFFDKGTEHAWRVALLKDYRIDYVFVGKGERDLGSFDAAEASYLEPVFQDTGNAIYRVKGNR